MKTLEKILNNLKYLTLFILVFFIVFLIIYPQASRCLLISISNFNKIDQLVYASPGTSIQEQDSLKSLLKLSDVRIEEFWGKKKSSPLIIYCHDPELYEKYGNESDSPANIFSTPWRSYIVIGPLGLNTDVMSHEASHAELSKRLGWWSLELSVPTWFNEGLALMVDYRFSNPDKQFRYEDYKKEWYRKTGFGATKVNLIEISSVKGFFKGESDEIYLSYLTSGMEVSRWLEKVGRNGLLEFIDKMNEGSGFGNAYLAVQKKHIKRYRYTEPYYQVKNYLLTDKWQIRGI